MKRITRKGGKRRGREIKVRIGLPEEMKEGEKPVKFTIKEGQIKKIIKEMEGMLGEKEKSRIPEVYVPTRKEMIEAGFMKPGGELKKLSKEEYEKAKKKLSKKVLGDPVKQWREIRERKAEEMLKEAYPEGEDTLERLKERMGGSYVKVLDFITLYNRYPEQATEILKKHGMDPTLALHEALLWEQAPEQAERLLKGFKGNPTKAFSVVLLIRELTRQGRAEETEKILKKYNNDPEKALAEVELEKGGVIIPEQEKHKLDIRKIWEMFKESQRKERTRR